MASSSRPVSDEELQKEVDLNENTGSPTPDEFNSPGVVQKKEKKKKKKRLCVAPPELVEMLLNYKCQPLPECKALAAQAEEDNNNEFWKDTMTAVAKADDLSRRYDDLICPALEKLRHDFETKGCITYEVSDDDEDDNNEGAVMASQQGTRGRKHRTGVVKHAVGGVKKLN